MQILIELSLPFSFSAGLLQAGTMRLCDGKDDLVISSQTWSANYLQSISEVVQSVNLLHGGNLADYEAFTFSIYDNNLLGAIETAGYSLNSAKVNLFTFDGGTKWPIWSGYVIDTSLANNELSINCENLSKALKTLDAPAIYGNHKKLKLEKDTSISGDVYSFETAPNHLSLHPNIIDIGSPKVIPANNGTYHKGLKVYATTVTLDGLDSYITIQYLKPVFSSLVDANGIPTKSIKAQWLTGENKEESYKIGKIVESTDGIQYVAKLYITSDFSSIDIARIDCLRVYENASFFKIPDNLNSIEGVSLLVDELFYGVDPSCQSVVTINGQSYLKIFTDANIYREVKLNDITLTANTALTPIGDGTSTDIKKATNQNLDDCCGFFAQPPSAGFKTEVILSMYPDLNQYAGQDIHFGIQMMKDMNTFYLPCTFSSNIHYLNQCVTPCSDNGNKAYNNFMANTGFYSAPIGSIVNPPTYSVSGMGPYTGGSQTWYPFVFEKDKLHKLPVDPVSYNDIEKVTISIQVVDNTAGKTYGTNYGLYRIFKVGIYVVESIGEDIAEIYIDTDGKCTYLIPEYHFGSTPIASNDSIAYDLLGSMGNTITSAFKYSSDTYNHYSAPTGTKTSESLEILSREGLFVTGSLEEGNIYSKPLVVHSIDGNVDQSINVNFIQSIDEPLKDIDLTEFINLPKITFTDSAGNDEWMEVISLDKAFPTSASINLSDKNYNTVFSFSSNFLAKLSANQTSITVYNYLKSLWDLCKESYTKNGITNQGTIDFQTIYLEDVLATGAKDKIRTIVQLNSQRRKRIVVTLPSVYGTIIPLKLGSRVKFHHPDIMQDNSLYGFLERVSINLLEAKTKISLILDTVKLGNGDIEFF